jgi:hypothetical protein
MQKLEQRTEKNTPTDASQVRGNCGLSLNKEETLSVMDLKTYSNNPEVNLHQHHTGGLKDVVYVISIEGKPLMPCSNCKARKLLKNKRAVVVKLYPFTIKLNFVCENQVQNLTLGIDSGYQNIGFSCISEKQELISGILVLDDKTSSRLAERKMYRRGRRNRHHWYREARFLNRKKNEGWLPPSIQRRYDTHINLINRLKAILPISEVIIEVAKFDIQKIENPDILGVGYQQGNMFNYQNIRSYLMAREHGLCQLCKKDFKDRPSHIHHCKQRNEQGSNRVENLAILHKECHKKLHKEGLKLNAPKQYKSNTFMSIINKRFWQDIPELKVTFGYITFIKRQEYDIEKTHNNDAFVIANGNNQIRCKPINIRQVHRNNRVLQLNRKGFKPSIKRNKSKVNPYDLFWVDKNQYNCKTMFNYGKYICFGDIKKKEYFNFKKVTKIYHFGSLIWN